MTQRRSTCTAHVHIEPMTKNTLSIDGQAYTALLYKLDDHNGAHPTSSARVFRRLEYAHPRLLLRIESARDTAREIVVATRNLSQGGVSILHASYMYPGTDVTIDLVTNKGSVRRTRGTVARCEHRGGIIHEIGIKFHRDINLREFLHRSPDLLLHAHERIEPEMLDKRILFASNDDDFSPIIRQWLLPTNIKFSFKDNPEQILAALQNTDIVLVHHGKNLDAPDLVATIRASGFNDPIIVAARPESDTQAHLLGACGADTLLPWPCEHNTLICAIAEYVLNDWTHESLALLRTCISPDTRRVLIDALATRGVVLDQHTRKHETDATRADCHAIEQLARTLSIEPIRHTAASIAQRLAAADHEQLDAEIAELARACTAVARKHAA
jgi:hypothetical protein